MPSVPQPPPGTLQVTYFGEIEGFPWKIVHHAHLTPTSDPSQADLDAITEGMRSRIADLLVDEQTSLLVYEGALSRFWSSTGAVFEGSALNPILGTASGDPCPLSTAIVVSWRVHSLWRGGKPRSYLPGLPESSISDGRTIHADALSSLRTHASAYVTNVNSLTHGSVTSVTLGCLRRFADGGSEARPKVYLDPPVFVPITSALVRSVIGSQRRRLHRT